ncbi:hypothetical protein D3C81_2327540 [compost metagenome]
MNCGPAKSGLSTPEPKLATPNRQNPRAHSTLGDTTFISSGTNGIRNSCGIPIHMITSPICKAL